MHVTVCIVAFRNPSDVVNCLQALGGSTHAEFDVVVCENGGPEAAEALRRALPAQLSSGQRVEVIEAPDNLGYAAGTNACIARSPASDAWWVLNPDTVPDKAAMAQLCARLKEADCMAVGCTVHYADGTVESRGGRWNPWLARAVSVDDGKDARAGSNAPGLEAQINYLNGASMLIGRDFVERVGLMREDYFLYAEEVEWCVRGVQAGLKLGLAPGALVLHHKGTTTGSVQRVSDRRRMPVYLDERNKLLLTRDRFPWLVPIAASASFALLFLRFARRAAWAQFGFGLAGWLAGLRNERGKPSWVDAELKEGSALGPDVR